MAVDKAGPADEAKTADLVRGARPLSDLELVVVGNAAPFTLPLPGEATWLIGRAATADLQLDDPAVSRHHARLVVSAASVTIEDLGSNNGTMVGDRRVEGGAVRVEPGDAIAIGPTRLLLRIPPRVEGGAVASPGRKPDVAHVALQLDADLVADDPRVRKVYEDGARAWNSDVGVLITGETGVGKDRLAEWIHRNSRRAKGPFVPIDVSALASGILESELFGHKKGSFANAVADKKGLLESADTGTAFLNEIGELAVDLQVKLLWAVHDKKFRRVGDTEIRSLNVRWIAATNKDLPARVREGKFREDLYFRLAVVILELPPLRQRTADIAPLAQLFIRRFCAEDERSSAPGLSAEAIGVLTAYGWPGNLRELDNVVRRAVVFCDGDIIQPAHLPPALTNVRPQPVQADADPERQRILDALSRCQWRREPTAAALGMGRTKLWKKMRDLGLSSPPDNTQS